MTTAVESADAAWPSPGLGWTAVALLSIAGIASYLDRVVINLMVEPIKAEFGLSDTGFAVLQGVAFGLFYTLMALPLGRLADTISRRAVIVAGLVGFSLFSMGSGLARNFTQLFLMRTGVGVGEASLTPAAYSMLSDYFPPEKLGKALGVFTMSAYAGIGLAFIAGGSVLGWLATASGHLRWIFGDMSPWRIAFVLVGLPGLVMAPLLLLVVEPARRGLAGKRKPESLQAVGMEIWSRRKTLVPMFAGFAFVVLPGYATTVWTPALFVRTFGWQSSQIGFWFGMIYLVCGTTGAFFGGWLCDRLTARGVADAPLKIAAFGFIGYGVLGAAAPLMSSAWTALALFAPAIFLSTMPYPLAGTAIQLITPNRLRAQISALYLTTVNLIGLGLGPIIVALITDYVFTDPGEVRVSMAIVNGVCAPIAMILFLMACAPFRALLTREREAVS